MDELQEKREDKAFERLTDAEFKLFDMLLEEDEEDLTVEERNFVVAMYGMISVMEDSEDEEQK